MAYLRVDIATVGVLIIILIDYLVTVIYAKRFNLMIRNFILLSLLVFSISIINNNDIFYDNFSSEIFISSNESADPAQKTNIFYWCIGNNFSLLFCKIINEFSSSQNKTTRLNVRFFYRLH